MSDCRFGYVRLSFLFFLSDAVIPIFIFIIVGYGLLTGCHIYDTFIHGAVRGLKIVCQILPTLIPPLRPGTRPAAQADRLAGRLQLLVHILLLFPGIHRHDAGALPRTTQQGVILST